MQVRLWVAYRCCDALFTLKVEVNIEVKTTSTDCAVAHWRMYWDAMWFMHFKTNFSRSCPWKVSREDKLSSLTFCHAMYNVHILKRLDQVQGSWFNKFRILWGRVETFIRFHSLTFTSYLLHLYPCAPQVQNVRNTSTAVRSRTLGMFWDWQGIEFAQTAHEYRAFPIIYCGLGDMLRHVATHKFRSSLPGIGNVLEGRKAMTRARQGVAKDSSVWQNKQEAQDNTSIKLYVARFQCVCVSSWIQNRSQIGDLYL